MHNHLLAYLKAQWVLHLLAGKKGEILIMFSNKRLLNRKGDRTITTLESVKFCTSKQPMSTTFLVSEFPIIWSKWSGELSLSFQQLFQRLCPPPCSPWTTVLDVLHLTWYFHNSSNGTYVFQLQQEQCEERQHSDEEAPNPSPLQWCGPTDFKMWL